ncbi:MAG: hypothetical protein ABI543_00390 [Ignavibacteria bacterium]
MNKTGTQNKLQSKALDILGSLNAKEFNQFGKYLDTFFVSNRNLKKLYGYLKRYYPSYESPNLSKLNIHKAVYPESAQYSDSKVRKLLSDMYKEAESYISITHLRKNKLINDKILLDEFDSRTLDNLFYAKYDEINSFLDSEGAHSYQFLEKHIIEWINISFHLERGMQHKIALNVYKRAEYIIFYLLSDMFTTLQDMNANLARYNLSQKVNLAQEFISNLDTEKLFRYIEKNFPENIILRIYYLSFHAFNNIDQEKYYFDLKKLVFNNLKLLHENSRRAAVTFLINYCVRKAAMNRQGFESELSENYNVYIKSKLYRLSGENYLRIDLFLHILGNYFNMGKIREAAEFLNENIQVIQPIHRKNMLSLCNAMIEFEKGEFTRSLVSASQLKSNTKLYKDSLKILILKNNFELKNYETALENIANYRKSMEKSESMHEQVKEKSMNFLLYLNRLVKLANKEPDKKLALELRNEVSTNKNIGESKWLIKKIDEIT